MKKSAGLGTGIDISQQQSIEELADSFMLLMSVTGFLEVGSTFIPIEQTPIDIRQAEEKTNVKKPVLTSFT
jgi:hypothetical protein